jgi:hypothetical protein
MPEELEMNTTMTRRLWLGGVMTAALAAGLTGALTGPAQAHEGKCPVCKLDVPQDTDKLDNEVALKSGRKRIEYRCVFCALSDSKSYTGDITVLAPSEIKGKPVLLSRKEGKWSVAPETAVFVGEKVNHRSCQIGYRALTTKDAFEKWQHANHELLMDAHPLSLEEFLKVAIPAK